MHSTDCEFKVTYDDIDKLKNSQMTELPSQIPCYEAFPKTQFQWFMSIFSRWTSDENICHIPAELNTEFPDIKPLTVRDMLETYWRGTS